MKKYLLPVGAGVVVFGVVTAFAASLTVNSSSLAAGNGTVGACNTSAGVSYTTAAGTGASFVVGNAVVTSAVSCHGMAYQVKLLGASNAVLATSPAGTLDANGGDTVDFSASNIDPKLVTSVAVVITG